MNMKNSFRPTPDYGTRGTCAGVMTTNTSRIKLSSDFGPPRGLGT